MVEIGTDAAYAPSAPTKASLAPRTSGDANAGTISGAVQAVRAPIMRGRSQRRDGGRDVIVIALGGNAIGNPDGTVSAAAQVAAVEHAMKPVAKLVARGYQVVISHGNGPQVGDLVVKNDVASNVSEPYPLYWCVAETQATIGLTIQIALERWLREQGTPRAVATVVTRVLVEHPERASEVPLKPVGRYMTEAEARQRQHFGEIWVEQGSKGWRRAVPSPPPLAIIDIDAIVALTEAGIIVVAGGGGGVPTMWDSDHLSGCEAVVDKDLTASRLASELGAAAFVIVTDVSQVVLNYGTPNKVALAHCTPSLLRQYAREGHFANGSMGPKVEAAASFVEQGGSAALVTSLDNLAAALAHLEKPKRAMIQDVATVIEGDPA